MRGRGLPQYFLPAASIRVLCAVIILFGIARNLPIHPFNLLAPGAMLHPLIRFRARKERSMSSFCLGCGNSMSEGERFCGICGQSILWRLPCRESIPDVAFGLPPETSGKAIFSLVCGILFLILPFSIVAVIFGHLVSFRNPQKRRAAHRKRIGDRRNGFRIHWA